MFNTSIGLGLCIGPLYGAMMVEKLNFRLTLDILALTILTFAIIYYAFAGGYEAFSKSFGGAKDEMQSGFSPVRKLKIDDSLPLRADQ